MTMIFSFAVGAVLAASAMLGYVPNKEKFLVCPDPQQLVCPKMECPDPERLVPNYTIPHILLSNGDFKYGKLRSCLTSISIWYGDTCAETDVDKQAYCVLDQIRDCVND